MADAVAELPPSAASPKVTLRKSRLLPEFPYPGLRPFRKEEWPVFCGRSEIVDELLTALGATHFVPVIGTSGCGKSSLIKAGLIATLEREHGALGSAWQTTEMRPENSPMWNLTEALWRATHADGLGSPEELSAMRASLGRGPGGIERVLKEYGFPDDRNLMILVDQFEELFRFGVLGGDAEIQLFTDQLIDVFAARPRNIHVTLTMRADFIADCARWPRLADALNRTAYLLRWLTEAEMREAITTPARLYRGTVDPDLVDRMIRDVGGKQDQLPIIQHALMWMWNRTAGAAEPGHLTLADYDGSEVRGVEGALSLHADQIYDSMATARPIAGAPPRDLRLCTKLLFQALSDVDAGNRVIRRPCAFGELCAITGCTAEELQYVIDQYRKPGTSFLMPDDAGKLQDNDTIDVSHEALIRQWSKMQGKGPDDGWLAEERRDAENWRALAREVRKFRDAKQKGRTRYLSGDQNDDLQAWWKQRAPSAAWAARYSSDAKQLFPFIDELLQVSAKRARVAAVQRRLLAYGPIALVVVSLVTFAWIKEDAARQAELKQQAAVAEKTAAQNQLTASAARGAAEDWRETKALVLTQHMLDGYATPISEGIGYRALTRQHLLQEWPDSIGADWSRDGRFIGLGSNSQGVIVEPAMGMMKTVDFSDLGGVQNLAIAPDGGKLAVSDVAGKTIALGSPTDPKALRVKIDGIVDFLWFSPDSRWVVGTDRTEIIVLDAVNNREVARWPEEMAADMAISDDSTYLATVSFDSTLSVRKFAEFPETEPDFQVNLAKSTPALEVEDQDHVTGQPAITYKDGVGLVAVPMKDRVELVDFISKSRRAIPYASGTEPSSVQFSHDGRFLVVGSVDGSLRRIEVEKLIGPNAPEAIAESPGELLPTLSSGFQVNYVRFSEDDQKLIVTSADGTALVIDLQTRAVLPLKSLANTILASFFGWQGEILSFDDDRTLRLWGTEPLLRPDLLEVMPGLHMDAAPTRAPTQKSAMIGKGSAPNSTAPTMLDLFYPGDAPTPTVAAKFDDAIRFYSPAIPEPQSVEGGETALLFDANGSAMVTLDGEGAVMMRNADAESWRKIGSVPSGTSVERILTDGANRALVVARSGGKFDWIDIAEPGAAPLPKSDGQVALAISPQAALRTSSTPSFVSLVPLGNGGASAVNLPLADDTSPVRTGALSRDGRYAAALQDNGTVSVWDIERGVLVALFGESDQKIAGIAFPPIDNAIDAIGLDGAVNRWPILSDTQELIDRIRTAIPSGVTIEARQEMIKSVTAAAPASAQ